MPQLRTLKLGDIDEPALPIRVAMDEAKLDDLADSMSKIGLLEPIIVKPLKQTCLHCDREEKAHTGRVQCEFYMRYEIECGHRRFLAAQRLHWKEIPALVFQPSELVEGAAMLAENICREDITAAEEALLFAQAKERFNLDEAGLINMFRRSPDYIADRLRLLREDQEVFKALHKREINFSVARELNKIPSEEFRRYYLDAAIRGGTNARTVASWRQQFLAQQNPATSASPLPVATAEVQGTPVHSVACFLCGGHLDPYNLESVYIHKWEKEQIIKLVKNASEVPA
jgi:ParB family chromosome partitioning protein